MSSAAMAQQQDMRTPAVISSAAYLPSRAGSAPFVSYAGHEVRSRTIASSTPIAKQPNWLSNREERLTVIQADVDEVRLFHQPPDLLSAFYQNTSYFVSFHPGSEPEQSITLPHEVPVPDKTKNGDYMVSKSAIAKKPLVQLQQYGKNAYVAQFLDNLALQRSHIDLHIAVYVWGIRSSLIAEESPVLLGRALLPMTDWTVQRKLVPWSVTDIPTGQLVGEVVLKFEVTTTPGPPRNPQVSDVGRKEVTLHWHPPHSDHGSPVVGYKVDLRRQDDPKQDPKWVTLCELTDGLDPVYCVTNLQPHRPYIFEVSAVNGVGVGDPIEFQVHTAPCEADAVAKPWLKKKKGDAVCVAWYASGWDGGAPVQAYKLVMRVLPGASKWNLFGPSEDEAAWADVNVIDCATHQHEHGPDIFSQWVQLEEPACEYRFKVYAINPAGRSKGSEFSSAHYTSGC